MIAAVLEGKRNYQYCDDLYQVSRLIANALVARQVSVWPSDDPNIEKWHTLGLHLLLQKYSAKQALNIITNMN
jgi:hypothetical protein